MDLSATNFSMFKFTDPPSNIAIVSLSWSQVILNWTSPFNEAAIDFADQYQLIIVSKKENVVVTAYKTHARIDGLKQVTNYLLNLRASNRLGYGPFLDTDIHFRTPGEFHSFYVPLKYNFIPGSYS